MNTKELISYNLSERGSFRLPLYAIFFSGQAISVSKKRVYRQPGRARAELIRYLGVLWDGKQYFQIDRKELGVAVDEMIQEGIIEIRQVV